MNPSGFSVIDQYLLERDQSQSVLADKSKMNIDQQVPAAHLQVCSTSGGFVTVSSGQTFSCNSAVQPALAPSPPSSSSSPPSSCSTPPRLVSPSSSMPPCWGGLVDLLPGPSPACALTQVCDQQVQPDDSRFLMDMDATNFYETPLHYSGCYGDEGLDGYPSKAADPFMMPPLVKMEPQEMQGDAVAEEEVELVSELKQQIINELYSDIAHDCAVLQISSDPRQWSVEDVRSWIDWTASRQLLTNVRLTNFSMPGSVLYNMGEEEFVRCDPANGGQLFTRLSFWKLVQSNKDREIPETRHALNKAYSALSSPGPAPCSPSSIISRDSCGDSQTPDTDSSDEGSHSPVPRSRACLAVSQDDDLRLPEGSEHKQTIHLWQFLKELLTAGDYYQRCIKWLDRSQGIFKIEDSVKVAKLWGKRKNRPAMNYDKLSRSIRQYYKKGIIKKTTHSKRLVYQFCAPYL